jgi:hypothetical protein
MGVQRLSLNGCEPPQSRTSHHAPLKFLRAEIHGSTFTQPCLATSDGRALNRAGSLRMACTLIDWNAVGAVATAAATLVALLPDISGLWHTRKVAKQRDRDAGMRGRASLAMQVPEIARLVA